MSPPELPPELWSDIFGLLKRDVPPPWKQATWSDFHQDDLASVCLVSVLFHDLAAPILYHSIVANDLPILVKCITLYDAPRAVRRRTQNKNALVARTKHLRIVGFGPVGKPQAKLQFLLRHGDWSMVGIPPDEALLYSREKAIKDLANLQNYLDRFGLGGGALLFECPPFARLETMVLGQRYDRGWDYLSEEQVENLGTIRLRHVGAFIAAHGPRVCVHNMHGPYAGLLFQYTDPGTTITSVTRHIYEYDGEKATAQVICGARNRWICYPGSIARKSHINTGDQNYTTDFINDAFHAAQITKRFEIPTRKPRWAQMTADTTVDIYGHAMGALPKSRLIADLATLDPRPPPVEPEEQSGQGKTTAQTSNISAFRMWDDLRSGEASMNKWIANQIHTFENYDEGWARKITFNRWQDSPACDCCGWSIKDCRV